MSRVTALLGTRSPVRRSRLSWFVAAGMAAALLLAVGCSKKDDSTGGTTVAATTTAAASTGDQPTNAAAATPAPTQAPTQAPTEQPTQAPSNEAVAAPGAVAEFAHVRVYLNAIQDPWTSDNQFIKPDAGKRFVSFDVTVEFFNDSGTHGANPFNFGLSDKQSFAYDPTFYGPDPRLASVSLRPGEKTRGWVTFQVTSGTLLQRLRYQPNFLKDIYIEFNFQ